MKTLMRNGRDRRSENPSLGHAKQERVSLFGTDQRITSGPAARRPHSKAEYMTAPERFADSRFLLHRGRRPYMTPTGPERAHFCCHARPLSAILEPLLYQAAETLTHLCHRRVRARRPYPIGPPYVFAMNVRVGRSQHEFRVCEFWY